MIFWKNLNKIIFVNIIIVVTILSILEVFLLCFFWFPKLVNILPQSMKYYPLTIYQNFDRTTIGYFSEWDKDLTYKIKPNYSYRFKNREFDVMIKSNSLGLRDDEKSLDAPDAIVLGDSFTMGFGIQQEKTYPELLSSITNFSVLNAGIESYGTAREVLLLDKIDTSNLKYLVIQYCENDFLENYTFVINNYTLPVTSKKYYYQRVEERKKSDRYYFGKYLKIFLSLLSINIFDDKNQYRKITLKEKEYFHLQHAKLFLDILSKLKVENSDFKLIIFDLVDRSDMKFTRRNWILQDKTFDSSLFINLIHKLIKEGEYPTFIENASLIDSSQFLSNDDYFLLDGHINSDGHKKVANKIYKTFKSQSDLYLKQDLTIDKEDINNVFVTKKLPNTAFRSEIVCHSQEIKLEEFSSKNIDFDLEVHNKSSEWWPQKSLVKNGNFVIRIRPHLYNDKQKLVNRDFPYGISGLLYSIPPNSKFTMRIFINKNVLPKGISYLEYDLVQEGYTWFQGKGGKTCRIKIIN
jgi:hypothetical protein